MIQERDVVLKENRCEIRRLELGESLNLEGNAVEYGRETANGRCDCGKSGIATAQRHPCRWGRYDGE